MHNNNSIVAYVARVAAMVYGGAAYQHGMVAYGENVIIAGRRKLWRHRQQHERREK